MCIISDEVESVYDTQIFVAPNESKTRQLTVYSNTVNNELENNAMILPVPNPDSVEFINLSYYDTFFEDCDDCFPVQGSFGFDCDRDYGFTTKSDSMLAVHKVGDYVASIAKNLDDIRRVDKSVFTLSKGCAALLEESYGSTRYGFIICKLVQGSKSYHPFAYSHTIESDALFIPTKHYHEHKNGLSQSLLITKGNREKFDHKIFVYNGRITTNPFMFKDEDYDPEEARVPFETLVSKIKPVFKLGELNCGFRKYEIIGHYENVDMTAILV